MNFDFKAMAAKAKDLLETAAQKTSKVAGEAREKADRAAEAVAAKCTELTGRETTAGEVKRAAAVVAGAVALGTVAVALAGSESVVAGEGYAASGGDGWGSDFESQMAKGFAEMGGSLNYYTPYVDSCGTVYSGPY